jgi:hypothetical protein
MRWRGVVSALSEAEMVDEGRSSHPHLTAEDRTHILRLTFAPPLPQVRRLLCSSRPIALRLGGVGAPREPVEADQTHQQQAQLAVLCRRATALGVGRGMFTLASAPAERVQSLQLAPLVLQGHTSPKGATIELDTSALETDHLLWPEFHNGCACALRLQPPGCGPAAHGELGRHWIMYSRPKTRRHAYAGVLMGLGLQGHLVALANTDIYRFMAQVPCFCRGAGYGGDGRGGLGRERRGRARSRVRVDPGLGLRLAACLASLTRVPAQCYGSY